jgi:hypothetical protein
MKSRHEAIQAIPPGGSSRLCCDHRKRLWRSRKSRTKTAKGEAEGLALLVSVVVSVAVAGRCPLMLYGSLRSRGTRL